MVSQDANLTSLRGRVNAGLVTAASVMNIGVRLAAQYQDANRRPVAIIGRDTRLSGDMLEAALRAGLTAGGMDVLLTGPLPTAAIAMLTRSLRADIGIVITGSHNPSDDNGLKIFDPAGQKLTLPSSIPDTGVSTERRYAAADRVGRIRALTDANARYVEHLKGAQPDADLSGLRVVLDCAHGAAYRCAPELFREMGAEVHVLGAEPDGRNINCDYGALAPTAMTKAVRDLDADLGVALDGDADRVIVADETGSLISADQILGLCASAWLNKGALKGDGVVGTINSNTGLERYARTLGLEFIRSEVGDYHLFRTMQAHGINLGGEHSGHFIFGDIHPTSDGLLAALHVGALLAQAKDPASLALRVFNPMPQRYLDLSMQVANCCANEAADVVATYQQRVNGSARIVFRQSQTEQKFRIMIEADSEIVVNNIANEITTILSIASDVDLISAA